ncbi:WD40 repeat-like protein [Polyplosphaeria fusca]|uniref:WD40 repeat-like protein n=1 Tax=Polyplosphaeria fusca TaxID=682080 RepID=A0A9P4VA58_9PLEO|nr:WD40 repeat-like protein [Polyplosphaeria fusca]
MDIHRSRFVPYQPSAINALAFSHAHPEIEGEDPHSLRLAVGRANGNIEIWNPTQATWLLEKTFWGGKDRSVEGLTWIQEPGQTDGSGVLTSGRLRLFSIGYSSSVTEWDLSTCLPLQHSTGNHSEVWCFAAQPKQKLSGGSVVGGEQSQQNLVAGCADGTLVILSTADNELRFAKFLSRSTAKKSRALTVAYKDRHVVLAGFADSTIRVFDTRNSNVLRSISLGSGPHGGPKEILVWKLRCLPNGDIVSGDSTGDIRIYDGKTFGQLQRISGHEADVLDLVVSKDGTTIFSGGLDRRTCIYTCSRKSGTSRAKRNEQWRKVSHKRYHEHDVKALASYEGHDLNIVVSGGIDTQPIVLPLRRSGKELSRGLATLPRDPPLVSAPEARLMVSWWNCEVRIWRIKGQQDATERPRVVARLALKGEENIASVAISRDGELLAIATASEVKLFQLLHATPGLGSALQIRKLDMPRTNGDRLVRFTEDGKWLAIITATNNVQLARVTRPTKVEGRPRVLPQLLSLDRLRRHDSAETSPLGPLGSYDRSITHAAFSTDGCIFAVSDLGGHVDTWVIEGHEDPTAPEIDIDDDASVSMTSENDSDDEEEAGAKRTTLLGQRWIRNPNGHVLPRLDSAPALLSFQPLPKGSISPEPNGNPAVHPTRHNPHPHSRDIPDTEQHLLVVTTKNQIYQFEVLAGRLSEWSKRNPPSTYPAQFGKLDDVAKGCIWDLADQHQRLWLYGEKWLFMFDLARDLPLAEGVSAAKKRKRGSNVERAARGHSGAGDAVPESEMPVTKVRKMLRAKDDESSKTVWVNVHDEGGDVGSDEDEQDKQKALTKLRRTGGVGDASRAKVDETMGEHADTAEIAEQKRQRAHDGSWHTFKYRPILGIVPVGGRDDALEVVVVERPSWDILQDLPPRFVGSHE